jgi:hypothetical protein
MNIDGAGASRHRQTGDRGGGDSAGRSGTRSAVKADTVDTEAAALVLAVIGQLEVDGLGTTALIVGDRGTARAAGCGVLTG